MNLEKIYKNSLRSELNDRLTGEEKQEIIKELLKNGESLRGLAKKMGVAHTTLYGWYRGRDANRETALTTLNSLYTKLMNIKPEDVKDWGRIELINLRCEELLRFKK